MTELALAYSSIDRARAEAVGTILKALGYSIAAQPLTAAQVGSAAAVLVFWSQASVNSSQIHAFASQAAVERKLVSIRAGDADPPAAFALVALHDLKDWTGSISAPALKALVNHLYKKAPPPRAETPPPTRVGFGTSGSFFSAADVGRYISTAPLAPNRETPDLQAPPRTAPAPEDPAVQPALVSAARAPASQTESAPIASRDGAAPPPPAEDRKAATPAPRRMRAGAGPMPLMIGAGAAALLAAGAFVVWRMLPIGPTSPAGTAVAAAAPGSAAPASGAPASGPPSPAPAVTASAAATPGAAAAQSAAPSAAQAPPAVETAAAQGPAAAPAIAPTVAASAQAQATLQPEQPFPRPRTRATLVAGGDARPARPARAAPESRVVGVTYGYSPGSSSYGVAGTIPTSGGYIVERPATTSPSSSSQQPQPATATAGATEASPKDDVRRRDLPPGVVYGPE